MINRRYTFTFTFIDYFIVDVLLLFFYSFNFALQNYFQKSADWLIYLVWLQSRPRRKDNLLNERNEGHSVKAHVKRQDGRLQAYGWSLPSRQPGTGAFAPTGVQTTPTHSGNGVKGPAAVGVPVPVYCRPLEDQEPGMKVKFNPIWSLRFVNSYFSLPPVNSCVSDWINL